MRRVAVAGAGMTRFGKWMDKSLKDLGRPAAPCRVEKLGGRGVRVLGHGATRQPVVEQVRYEQQGFRDGQLWVTGTAHTD